MTRSLTDLPRFDYVAENIPEALAYYRNRATELLSSSWSWDGSYIDLGWGIQVKLLWFDAEYDSVYVLDKGQGHLAKWFDSEYRNFVTMEGCESMHEWLLKKGHPFMTAENGYNDWKSYRRVKEFYGDRRADRTKVFLMNHIDEGLYILGRMRQLKVREVCGDIGGAYMLHPLYQDDDAVLARWNEETGTDIMRATFLAMEYRSVANAYLPKRKIGGIDEIRLSPLEEVNTILWADKIQNRKDFEAHHLGTHPNSDGLVQYFKNWFERLGISEEFYLRMVNEINDKTGNQRVS